MTTEDVVREEFNDIKTNRHANAFRLGLLFLILFVVYLIIAAAVLWPMDYYGTAIEPRFADPWIARSQTILSGGLLYRDVFTSTPPLTNLLLLIPSLVPILVGNINPWATLSFMVFFSLFNLFTALLLLRMLPTRASGFQAAAIFLLNPLTFGNTLLRRQDESIVVFFIAVALFFVMQKRHSIAGIAIGLSLLVKLSSGMLMPVAILHTRDWRYLILPLLVFLVILSPFLVLAGRDAIFWDFGTREAQHPFQFGGVSLVALWNRMSHDTGQQISLFAAIVLMVAGVGLASILILWKQFGLLEDTIVLATAILLFSPKLHTGYFSLLVLFMSIIIRKWQLIILFFVFGAAAIVADIYKWPIVDYRAAFYLMIVVHSLMALLTTGILRNSRARRKFSSSNNALAVGSNE